MAMDQKIDRLVIFKKMPHKPTTAICQAQHMKGVSLVQ